MNIPLKYTVQFLMSCSLCSNISKIKSGISLNQILQ